MLIYRDKLEQLPLTSQHTENEIPSLTTSHTGFNGCMHFCGHFAVFSYKLIKYIQIRMLGRILVVDGKESFIHVVLDETVHQVLRDSYTAEKTQVC